MTYLPAEWPREANAKRARARRGRAQATLGSGTAESRVADAPRRDADDVDVEGAAAAELDGDDRPSPGRPGRATDGNHARGDAIQVKILDFGIAKLLSPARFTGTSMAMGTAYYMAPEQQTDAAEVDGRADLFSVSVILYEMLTGKLPAGRWLPSLGSGRLSPVPTRTAPPQR